jgi:hypothetical protein
MVAETCFGARLETDHAAFHMKPALVRTTIRQDSADLSVIGGLKFRIALTTRADGEWTEVPGSFPHIGWGA